MITQNLAYWTETNPLFDKLEFPYLPSPAYLRHPARRGKNLIWMTLTSTNRKVVVNQWTESWAVVTVNCYARAESKNEDAITDAQQRAQNMKGQVLSIVQSKWDQFGSAWLARPTSGEREMLESGIEPIAYITLLPVEFWTED